MNLIFEKESNGFWYVVLPQWTGNKDDLQMVLGADTMLDIISENGNECELFISLEDFEDSTCLRKLRDTEFIGGADYFLHEYEDEYLCLEIWLCAVTEFVFGEMPQNIYFKKV